MLADFYPIITWWFNFLVIGLCFLPVTTLLFNRFWDKGYIFSKIIGSIILSYLVLVFGILKIFSFSRITIISLLISLFIINLVIALKKPLKLTTRHKIVFALEELLFLAILTVWSYVRGFAPDIEGLEKFMDWGFVNSILRSQYGPPADMWFSPLPINYYYFGHYLIAIITNLSRIPSTITYNLAIASTCALTFVSSFSLASNIVRSIPKVTKISIIVGGLFSALLLTFGGNLHPIYKIGSNIIKNEGKLILTTASIKKAADSYWYPDATRFIGFDPDIKDKTIHEFPLYSFVVADLHGHMNGIPIILLIVALIYISFYHRFFLPLPLGFLLSVAYMTNAWDFAIYGLLFAFTYFFVTKNVIKTILFGLSTIVFWFIFTLPFSLNFTPMAEGLKFSDMHTPFYQLFVLYGGFWLICLPLVIFLIKKYFTNHRLLITDYFVLGLMATATLLVIIPEIGYIKDIYVYDHRRANTMFKLVYQAFIIYSLTAGYCLIRLRQFIIYKALFSIIFISQIIYPYFAIKSFYGFTKYHGLYGLNFIKSSYPDNFRAINWINQNISGQPTIVEAVGDSYTTYGQFSIATGLPTVQGWVVHEWLWRGGYDLPAARQTDVQTIYESSEIDQVKTLLDKYNVLYIIVGDKEYEKYPNLNVANFDQLGKVVFESGKTRIYQLF